jgi:hypothetical protein
MTEKNAPRSFRNVRNFTSYGTVSPLMRPESSATHPKLHINPLNAELNPICHLPALLRTHLILHVSRIRVNYSRW